MSNAITQARRQALCYQKLFQSQAMDVRRCVVCGCTDHDSSGCIVRTGKSCSWDPDFKRHNVCTACSRVYYIATFKPACVRAVRSLVKDRAELYRARDFAVRLGNVQRANLIQGYIDRLKAKDFAERGKAVVK